MNATDEVKNWCLFYERIGVEPAALTGRHAECPICGAADGFRTNIKNKPDGTWVCKHCSCSKYAGPLEFVLKFTNSATYTAAAAFIYRQLERNGDMVDVKRPKIQTTETKVDFGKEVEKRKWMWEKLAKPVTQGDPVWKYLKRRITNLKDVPLDIRYLPKAQYWEIGEDRKGYLVGTYDAMLVRGFDKDENVVQLHTTYLTPDGEKANVKNPKKTKTSIGSNSYVFRIGEIGEDGELGLAEGIETSLACNVKFNKTVWSCHSCSVLANFVIPEIYKNKITKITIYADNDGWRIKPDGTRWNPGLTKARELAERLRNEITYSGQKLKVVIVHTSQVGDFAD